MPANVRLLYSFNADVVAVSRAANRITIDIKDWKPLAFTASASAHADAVMALQDGGATLSRLTEIAGASGDADRAAKAVSYYVERFARGRLLAWSLVDDDGELARVDALASSYRPKEDAPPVDALALCRFAYLRRLEAGAVLDSALVPARLVLSARGLAAFADSVAQPAATAAFAIVLWRLGFFDIDAAPESEARRCWEFHDLVMHQASRSNRDTPPLGGTYRFDGVFPSPPAIKPAIAGEQIALPAIDPARVRQASNSLDAVQAARRSVRTYAPEPISLAALSEFLWRVCRTTGHIESPRQDLMSRPYPAGGSINELEFYLAVRRCSGLEPAVHHYDSHHHGLVRLAGSDKIASRIVERAGQAMGLAPEAQRPDVAVVIASRLPRLAWKYQAMAYRASLMNAGVVFQLMYLVATDMKLAPCANGTGDSRLLQAATGIDPFEETAIGEFCLGVRATP